MTTHANTALTRPTPRQGPLPQPGSIARAGYAQRAPSPTLAARPTQQGVALVVVLWVMMLLAVIAGNFAFGVRAEMNAANNRLQIAQARALADAGIQRGIYERLKPAVDQGRWMADGRPYQFELGGAMIYVWIQSEAGKIDLNAASDTSLLALFQFLGLPDDQAGALRDAVLDWRDHDSIRRPRGAEAADYQGAGLRHGPANAPFADIEELQQVMGMTPEIYSRLIPMVTTAHGQPTVDPLLASGDVLRVIAGSSIDAIMRYRAQAAEAQRQGLPLPPLPVINPYLNPGMGAAVSAYTIHAEAVLPSGLRQAREWTVRLQPGTTHPFEVLMVRTSEAQALAGGDSLPPAG